MNVRLWMNLLVCVAFLALSGSPVFSADTDNKMIGHAFYGKMNTENDDSDLGGGDFEITLFGADGQQSRGGDTFKYGWETGALFSIDSDTRSMAASSGSGGGTVIVAVDVNSIMIDYFLGGYLANLDLRCSPAPINKPLVKFFPWTAPNFFLT